MENSKCFQLFSAASAAAFKFRLPEEGKGRCKVGKPWKIGMAVYTHSVRGKEKRLIVKSIRESMIAI